MDIMTIALARRMARGGSGSDGAAGIAEIKTENGKLIFVLEDGSQFEVEIPEVEAAPVSSIDINEDGHLIFVYPDGTTVDAGPLPTQECSCDEEKFNSLIERIEKLEAGGGSCSTGHWEVTDDVLHYVEHESTMEVDEEGILFLD